MPHSPRADTVVSPAIFDIASFRPVFDEALTSFLVSKRHSFDAYELGPFLTDVIAHPERIVRAGGKRVRPYVALLMYRAGGGHDYMEALSTLVSLEVFHNFCLMHDDIIDRGTERHGLPTSHVYTEGRLTQKKRRGDAAQLGQGFALLLGDLMFAWAYEAFNASCLPRDRIEAARQAFSKMINEVVIGQIIDVDVMTRDRVTSPLIERKMRLKTASYTFVRPMQVGLNLAADDPRLSDFCEQFGTSVGLGFQIQDDLLDITAEPEVATKTLFADLREHQHTFFTQHIFERGTKSQQTYLRRIFGSDITMEQRDEVLALFEDSGALKAGRTAIGSHFAEAERLLASAEIDEIVKLQLASLLDYIKHRSD